MGVPCNGELEFWSVAKAQLRNIAVQLARIADALELSNSNGQKGTGAPAEEPK